MKGWCGLRRPPTNLPQIPIERRARGDLLIAGCKDSRPELPLWQDLRGTELPPCMATSPHPPSFQEESESLLDLQECLI